MLRSEARSFDAPGLYVISVEGNVDASSSAYLQDLRVATRLTDHGKRVAILSGELLDQAALMGVLLFLNERGCVVLSVNRLSTL